MKNPNLRMIRFGDFFLGILRLLDRKPHVGLARTKPDVADENVRDPEGILAFNAHLKRAGGFHWPKCCAPFSMLIGGNLLAVCTDRNDYSRPRIGRSPVGNLLPAL